VVSKRSWVLDAVRGRGLGVVRKYIRFVFCNFIFSPYSIFFLGLGISSLFLTVSHISRDKHILLDLQDPPRDSSSSKRTEKTRKSKGRKEGKEKEEQQDGVVSRLETGNSEARDGVRDDNGCLQLRKSQRRVFEIVVSGVFGAVSLFEL